jgi:hypothetical protein
MHSFCLDKQLRDELNVRCYYRNRDARCMGDEEESLTQLLFMSLRSIRFAIEWFLPSRLCPNVGNRRTHGKTSDLEGSR